LHHMYQYSNTSEKTVVHLRWDDNTPYTYIKTNQYYQYTRYHPPCKQQVLALNSSTVCIHIRGEYSENSSEH
jgi:hypothetical protein